MSDDGEAAASVHEGEEVEEEHAIVDKPLSKEMAASSLSMLSRLGYGLAHAYIKFQCVSRNITDISLLEKYVHLRIVILSGNYITDLTPLSGMRTLMYLKADHNRVAEGGQVKPLDHLQFFDLSYNKLTNTDGFSHRSLKHLVLNHNTILSLRGEFSPPLNHQKLPSLQTLEVRGNKLTTTEGLTYLSKVATLYAAANMIKSLENISYMTGLVRLHLRDNHIKKLDWFNSDLVNLEYLNLRGNEVKRFREVRKLAVLPALKYLVLSDNPISEHEEYRAVVLGTLPHLEKLDKETATKDEIAEAINLVETRVSQMLVP
nr:unnamed protein product [Spirometra erinaceieuropaei]